MFSILTESVALHPFVLVTVTVYNPGVVKLTV